jgi:gas vesicle protein
MWDIFKIVLLNIIDYFFKLLNQAFDYDDKEEKIKEIKEIQKNFNNELNKQIKLLSAEIDEKFDELKEEIDN